MTLKSKTAKSIIDIFAILSIFIIGELIGISLVLLFNSQSVHELKFGRMGVDNSMSIALLLGNLVSIVLLMFSRYILTAIHWLERVDFIEELSPYRLRWKWAPLVLMGCLAGTVFSAMICQIFHLQYTAEESIENMSIGIPGIIVIVFVAPIVEELIFRHAMLGGMLRRGVQPWIAILVSAFLFGLIHMNPAQTFAAFVLGLMFGMMYTKSRSVVPSILAHMFNNSLPVLAYNLTAKYGEIGSAAGEERIALPISLTITAGSLIVGVIIFVSYWRQKTLYHHESSSSQYIV